VRRILEVMRKEFLQIRRDKRFLPMILISPLIQLFFFGYAATSDLKNVRIVVWDQSNTAESRRLIDRFTHSGYFTVVEYAASEADLACAIDTSRAGAAIRIPPDLSRRIAHAEPSPVQILLDGTNASTATIVHGYIQKIIFEANAETLKERLAKARIPRATLEPVLTDERIWYNPELRSVNFMVPGTVCLILLILTTMYTATAVVRERERGTLDQLVVTPIQKHELLVGKVIPYCLIGMVDVVLIICAAMFWFRVPMQGSIPLLFALAAIFLLSTTGLGLFVSATATTQQQAMIVCMFINNVMILLSGFLFPIDNMPIGAQYVAAVIPVRYFLEIVRGIFLKGAGLEILWPSIWPMALFGVAMITLSVIRFQKRVG